MVNDSEAEEDAVIYYFKMAPHRDAHQFRTKRKISKNANRWTNLLLSEGRTNHVIDKIISAFSFWSIERRIGDGENGL